MSYPTILCSKRQEVTKLEIFLFCGNFKKQQFLTRPEIQNLPEFHGIIRQVEVLGYEKSPEWKTDAEGLHVKTSGFYSEFPGDSGHCFLPETKRKSFHPAGTLTQWHKYFHDSL